MGNVEGGMLNAKGAGAVFGGAVRVAQLDLPDELMKGKPFVLKCGLVLEKYSLKKFGEYSVFIHWHDAEGRQVYVMGFPLARVMTNGENFISVDCGVPLGLKPGEYQLEMGIVNGRTQKRLSVSGSGVSRESRHGRKIPIGNLRIY